MDEKHQQLIVTLSENLQKMSINQTHISGFIDLILCIVLIAIWHWWFSFVKRKTTAPPKTEYVRFSKTEWYDDTAEFAHITVFITFILMLIALVIIVPNMLAAFLNT